MREMKDSGIKWIGSIPLGWEITRVKNVAKTMQSGGTPDSSNDSFYVNKEEGIPWVAIADMSNTPYVKETSRYISEEGRKSKNLIIFKPGTILYAMYASVGKVAELVVPATINQALLAIELNGCISNAFFKYALNAWEPYIISESNGTTQFNLNANKVANLYFPMPKRAEQENIVQYLNIKYKQINNLVSNIQAQIEKLKSYKQSLITDVVTKGLNHKVPMKNSGIDWIGKVPDRWDIIKLKYITYISRGLFNHRPRNDPNFYDGKYPFIQTGDVARAEKYITTYSQTLNENGIQVSKQFPKGTITMTIAANVGDVAILGFDAYFPDSVVGFTVKDGYDENYVYYLFKALKESFVRSSIVSTQLNLNIDRAKEIIVPITYDKVEQKKIASYLEVKCSQVDNLIAIKESKIKKLEQYKRSLIYEYVTGKKRVS